MKIFKWWQKIIFFIVLGIIAFLFFLVAFKSKDEDVQRWSLFASLFIGVATLGLSFIALSISIQTFVKTNKQEQEKRENEAQQFIIEHNKEIDYIPLCLIASFYDRHRKYNRNIYTDFNKLKNDLQTEVLKQLNYENNLIKNNDWFLKSQTKIESFIIEYNFGKDFLFNYLKIVPDFFDEKYNLKDENLPVVPSIFLGAPVYEIVNKECLDKGVSFSKYAHQFLHAVINNDFRVNAAPKPLDFLIVGADLENSDDKSKCLWSIIATDAIAKLIMEKPTIIHIKKYPSIHANIETIEDRYLLLLATLYDLGNCKEAKK